MRELPTSVTIEEKVSAALSVPEPDPDFLQRLDERLLAHPGAGAPPAARRTGPNERLRTLLLRPAWVLAVVLLLALLAAFLAAGPQRVLAAVRGWLGYLPGIGFVEQDAALRVLPAPAGQERDGITVTVEQVVADSQRTTVVFKVEGLGPQHRPGSEDAPFCSGSPYLRTAAGQELSQAGGEGEGWRSGYRSRAIFPALPEQEDGVMLVIPCLLDTRPDAAPENWEFPLALQPAPPDFQPLPVIELTDSPAEVPMSALTAEVPAAPLAPTPGASPHGIHFQVEKLVELEDSYLLQGSLDWQGTEFELAYFNPEYLQVRDAAGQTVPVEAVQSDSRTDDPYADQRQTWTIQTISKDYASPLTITLPAVAIDQQVQVPFEVDLGAAPQLGQTWELKQTLEAAGRPVTVESVTLEADSVRGQEAYGLAFTVTVDPDQFGGVSLSDPDYVRSILSSSGSSDLQGNFLLTLKYDHLPAGLHRILISDVSYPLFGPWAAQVNLPHSSAPTAPPAAPPTPEASASPHGIQLQVERLVELEDGFLFDGSFSWEGTALGEVGFDSYELQVVDAAGQPVPIEPVQSDTGARFTADQRQIWSVRTAAKGYASPLTFTLPSVTVYQQVDVTFDLDLGAEPLPGQTWELNREIEVNGRSLRLETAVFTQKLDGAYWLEFTFHADPQAVLDLSLWDPDNHSARVSGAGGSDGSGVIQQSFSYDYLPAGVRRLQINRLTYPLIGPWRAAVDLPKTAASYTPAVLQPSACLTPERLAQLETAPPAPLPDGLDGRLLVNGPAVEGVHFPTLYVVDLDGANRVTVGSGGWADLSPDGRRVIYTFSDGLHLADLESGQNLLLPWAQGNDYHPVWSPDGEWIAFERSSDGIYVARPDGTGLHKVPGGGASTSLLGWRPDGKGLVITTQGSQGNTLQTLDLESGAAVEHFTIDGQGGGFGLPSPDGLRVAYYEKIFGQPANGVFVAGMDGSDKRLVASLGLLGVSASAWSPDGRWLLLTVFEATFDDTLETSYLVQPDTCEVIPLTWIEAGVSSWSEAGSP